MNRCFGFRKRECQVLNVDTCPGKDCSFYKTPSQYKADQKAAVARVKCLEPMVRTHILGKYYGKDV